MVSSAEVVADKRRLPLLVEHGDRRAKPSVQAGVFSRVRGRAESTNQRCVVRQSSLLPFDYSHQFESWHYGSQFVILRVLGGQMFWRKVHLGFYGHTFVRVQIHQVGHRP